MNARFIHKCAICELVHLCPRYPTHSRQARERSPFGLLLTVAIPAAVQVHSALNNHNNVDPLNLPCVRLTFLTCRLASYACQADMPELLAFVLSLYPHLTASPGGKSSLQHACIQHRSLAALQTVLNIPGVQVCPPPPTTHTYAPPHITLLTHYSPILHILRT